MILKQWSQPALIQAGKDNQYEIGISKKNIRLFKFCPGKPLSGAIIPRLNGYKLASPIIDPAVHVGLPFCTLREDPSRQHATGGSIIGLTPVSLLTFAPGGEALHEAGV